MKIYNSSVKVQKYKTKYFSVSKIVWVELIKLPERFKTCNVLSVNRNNYWWTETWENFGPILLTTSCYIAWKKW